MEQSKRRKRRQRGKAIGKKVRRKIEAPKRHQSRRDAMLAKENRRKNLVQHDRRRQLLRSQVWRAIIAFFRMLVEFFAPPKPVTA